VDSERVSAALAGLLRSIRPTFAQRPAHGRPLLPIGYYANVLNLGGGLGLAITTDGVGTKALVAQMLDKYDTIGIDCVAMNANDIICVGAEPIAMTDYLAVRVADEALFTELGKGLRAGAEQAGISIPGGEVAQIGEMIHGAEGGHAFDLVGTCVGTLPLSRILIGQGVQPGDLVIGLASSGVHSNGLSLAREVFFKRAGRKPTDLVPELERTLGEELLEPTVIYVRFALDVLRGGVAVKAFAHITGDGLLNLARVAAPVGFVLDALPEPPTIFRLIQALGGVPDAEMFRVFNMGIGLCVVAPPASEPALLTLAQKHGHPAWVLGHAVADPEKAIHITAKGLEGRNGRFQPAASRPS
ncbi:MAG: phosphoribosylformylglycinamidine cyclo-ligase, partial [Dehalococcoidia bacterium]|nr:phosphoribosylformylglycinamidine cyclo-ligase [Dehalococcoidia bacterium]